MQRINLRVLYALSKYVAAGQDEGRRQLRSVRIEADPGKGVLMVATNGHILVAWLDNQVEVPARLHLTVSERLARSLPPSRKGEYNASEAYGLLVRMPDGHWSIGYGGRTSKITSACDDLATVNEYPNWRMVMPREIAQPMPNVYGSDVLAPLNEFAVELGVSPPFVYPGNTPDGPGLLMFEGAHRDRFTGCVMGRRLTGNDCSRVWAPPAWATV